MLMEVGRQTDILEEIIEYYVSENSGFGPLKIKQSFFLAGTKVLSMSPFNR